MLNSPERRGSSRRAIVRAEAARLGGAVQKEKVRLSAFPILVDREFEEV